jgi:predicted PurR-regulated permease PerM
MNFLLDSSQGTVLGMLVILSITLLILVVVMRLPRKIKNILENLSIAQSRENSEILNALADRLLRNQSTLNENLRSFLSNELNQLRSNSGAFQVKLIEEQSVAKEKTLSTIGEMRNEVQAKLDLIRSDVIARILEKLSEQSRA